MDYKKLLANAAELQQEALRKHERDVEAAKRLERKRAEEEARKRQALEDARKEAAKVAEKLAAAAALTPAVSSVKKVRKDMVTEDRSNGRVKSEEAKAPRRDLNASDRSGGRRNGSGTESSSTRSRPNTDPPRPSASTAKRPHPGTEDLDRPKRRKMTYEELIATGQQMAVKEMNALNSPKPVAATARESQLDDRAERDRKANGRHREDVDRRRGAGSSSGQDDRSLRNGVEATRTKTGKTSEVERERRLVQPDRSRRPPDARADPIKRRISGTIAPTESKPRTHRDPTQHSTPSTSHATTTQSSQPRSVQMAVPSMDIFRPSHTSTHVNGKGGMKAAESSTKHSTTQDREAERLHRNGNLEGRRKVSGADQVNADRGASRAGKDRSETKGLSGRDDSPLPKSNRIPRSPSRDEDRRSSSHSSSRGHDREITKEKGRTLGRDREGNGARGKDIRDRDRRDDRNRVGGRSRERERDRERSRESTDRKTRRRRRSSSASSSSSSNSSSSSGSSRRARTKRRKFHFNPYMDNDVDIRGGNISSVIDSIFKVDRSRWRRGVDDDSDMEAGASDILKEEKRSARIAKKEDEEEERREREEEERKRRKKLGK
ncbi:hypothetical protein HDV00_011120 [Rhizophlyctis rosea]|nr:hypothetical protein HDV00_011120 [Rhizophlyctis rosea]